LEKLDNGDYDAIILACAGLVDSTWKNASNSVFHPHGFCPLSVRVRSDWKLASTIKKHST